MTFTPKSTGAPNKNGTVTSFTLIVNVTDAGDHVFNATVSANGKRKKTSALGIAKLTVIGKPEQKVTVTITDPGYQVLKKKVKL